MSVLLQLSAMPYPYRFQNRLEIFLLGCSMLVVVLGVVYAFVAVRSVAVEAAPPVIERKGSRELKKRLSCIGERLTPPFLGRNASSSRMQDTSVDGSVLSRHDSTDVSEGSPRGKMGGGGTKPPTLEAAAAGTLEKSEAQLKMEALKEGIDTFLLYDFFVILFILSWLIVGVLIRLSYHQGLAYAEPFVGLWLILWPFLFQPLLGVHMLATLVSPIIGKLKDKGLVSKDTWT